MQRQRRSRFPGEPSLGQRNREFAERLDHLDIEVVPVGQVVTFQLLDRGHRSLLALLRRFGLAVVALSQLRKDFVPCVKSKFASAKQRDRAEVGVVVRQLAVAAQLEATLIDCAAGARVDRDRPLRISVEGGDDVIEAEIDRGACPG